MVASSRKVHLVGYGMRPQENIGGHEITQSQSAASL